MKRASGGAKVVVGDLMNHTLGVVAEVEVDGPMNRASPEVAEAEVEDPVDCLRVCVWLLQ